MSHIHTKHNRSSLLEAGERVTEEQHVEEMKLIAFERSVSRMTRRNFFTTAGIVAGAAGTLGLAGCSNSPSPITTTPAPPTTAPPAPTPTPTPAPATPSALDVLNFALNLEYLEASFYLYITTGGGLSTGDMGTNPGAVTGGAKVNFTNSVVSSIATQLAMDEMEHVQFLRATITAAGGTPVGMPALNLAANGAVTSDATFLTAARQLETVGVSAYAGGAQYLVSNPAALTYAAQILHVEAQHEGYLRQLCINLGVASSAVDSQDLPPASSAIFNTSPTTGLNPVRTTSQVLQIVYGAAGQTGVAKGGFFPAGLNGTIVSS